MKKIGMLKAAVLALACLGMLIPAPVLNAAVGKTPVGQTIVRPSAVTDVALQTGGTLHGQVRDIRNTPMPQTPVFLVQANVPIRNTVTNRAGGFSFSKLRGGTYQIVSSNACGTYRLWAPNTAPPLAQATAMVSEQPGVVRGQTGPIGYWLTNPWVLASLVAVAVAVPVILHNSRSSRVASP